MKKYNVGDKIWFAHCGHREVTKTCPICFGKKEVTLILGNDDKVIIECNYCGSCSHYKGYDYSSGYIKEYEYVAEPEQFTITHIKSECSKEGETYTYHSDHYYFEQDIIFDTREEALAKCNEIVAQKEKEETTRAEYLKNDKHKNFAWNACYHLRTAKKNREEAEWHEKLAKLCKERSKE